VTRRFAITFDYLCPFARNANEHVLTGLRAGADWDVHFLPYSLAQGHVEEDQQDVWERTDPHAVSGLLALQVGITVRDRYPERFFDVHEALFAARHDAGADIKDRAVLADTLQRAGVPADALLRAIDDGGPLGQLQKEHEQAVHDHGVWGVPTFVTDRRAVFVRLLDRPDGDAELATTRIEQVVDLVDGPLDLHEFKQVDLPI
jgi:hypothetical protein